jgi:hypothetical protein
LSVPAQCCGRQSRSLDHGEIKLLRQSVIASLIAEQLDLADINLAAQESAAGIAIKPVLRMPDEASPDA